MPLVPSSGPIKPRKYRLSKFLTTSLDTSMGGVEIGLMDNNKYKNNKKIIKIIIINK